MEGKKFYAVIGPDGWRQGGAPYDFSGVFDKKKGKLWTSLGALKSHLKLVIGILRRSYDDWSRVPSTVQLQRFVETLPEDQVIVEFELVERRRLPVRELWSKTAKWEPKR